MAAPVNDGPDAPLFGLIDLLGVMAAAVFVVGTLLVTTPWTLRLACLGGAVGGVGAAWLATRRRTWDQKLLGLPVGALIGLAVGAASWSFAGSFAGFVAG